MADTLFSLAEQIRRCTACPLYKNRTLAVPGEGKVGSRLMLIGEAPGAEEDRTGLPFVGRSGKFLDMMLSVAGLNRGDVFVTGACKCRPPKNRTPSTREITTCHDLWLVKQIDILKPELIVVLGGVALKSLLGDSEYGGEELKKLHGKLIAFNNLKYFVTYHPSAGMRFPLVRTMMKGDFEKLGRMLNAITK